jgi:alpha-galactosidase
MAGAMKPMRLSGREGLTTEALEIQWDADCRISVRDTRTDRTHIAGGMLVELASVGGERRRQAARVVLAETDGEAEQPDAGSFEPVLRRSLRVGGAALAADCSLQLTEAPGLIRIDLTLRNEGTEPLRVQRVFPFVGGSWWDGGQLSLAGIEGHFSAYKNGWQSWSYAGGLPEDKPDLRPRTPTSVLWHLPGGRSVTHATGQPVDVVSDAVALVGRSDLPVALLAGFLDGADRLGQLYLQRREGALAACVQLDDRVLNPGESVELPPLVLGFGPSDALLPTYADMVARTGHARRGERTYTGWCTRYYYFGKVGQRDVLENLATLQRMRDVLPLDLVQIDDGYQAAVGDWTDVNDRFPDGMAALAARIRAAGFRPGIWLAPFTVAANSTLARDHPEWLIHDAAGKPLFGGKNWNTTVYGLDTSHPEARAWLRRLFTTVVREWGYDYLKLDFLASAALPGRRHDAHISRMRALRDGLELIREVAGDEVYILGCGCPLLSGVGVVDAMRIGPDSAPHWLPTSQGVAAPPAEGHVAPAMQGALRNTLARAWMHPALWTNDPDCLLVRESESRLTLDEVRAFATAVALTGGMVLDSDRLSRLTLERLDLLAKLLPPLPERALPSDPFAFDVPERVVVPIERMWGSRTLVGLFNQDRHERELACTWPDAGLAPGAYHAVEFWTGAYLGRSAEGVRVRVPPHGAALLGVTPADDDEPLLLSTSFHAGQGAAEVAAWRFDRKRREVRWQARLGRHAVGTFMLWLPRPWQIGELTSTALGTSWRKGSGGEVLVDAEIRGEAEFVLQLERDDR